MVREWNNAHLVRNKTKKTWSFCHDFLLSYTSKRSDQYIADFHFLKINQEIYIYIYIYFFPVVITIYIGIMPC